MTARGFDSIDQFRNDASRVFAMAAIEQQLAHTVGDPNGYNKTAHQAKRRATMQQQCDYPEGLKSSST
jgi:hypothetical protein